MFPRVTLSTPRTPSRVRSLYVVCSGHSKKCVAWCTDVRACVQSGRGKGAMRAQSWQMRAKW